MQAYCVKCRVKKEMRDPKSITMKNGSSATQGICPTRGTKYSDPTGIRHASAQVNGTQKGWIFPVSGYPALVFYKSLNRLSCNSLSGVACTSASPPRHPNSQRHGNQHHQAYYDRLLGRSSVDGYGAHG